MLDAFSSVEIACNEKKFINFQASYFATLKKQIVAYVNLCIK